MRRFLQERRLKPLKAVYITTNLCVFILFLFLGCADLFQLEVHEDSLDVQDRGDSIIICFNYKEKVSRAVINKPRVTNLDELKIGSVTNLKEADPSLLECNVEKFLWDR